MKRRIEQLINGKFEYEPVALRIWPERIDVNPVPDAVVQGTFHIVEPTEKKVKGFLYTSSPRVICNLAEFQGISNEIHYQIDCSGLKEGAREQGRIDICTDHGEYTIPYDIRVQTVSKVTPSFPVQDMESFVALARGDFQQAYRLFISPRFRSFLTEAEPELLAMYDGLISRNNSYRCLEEFLTGAGKKEAVEIQVSQDTFTLENLSEPTGQILTFTKNTWGFQKIDIESDARFLRPEKKLLTTDEFAGSTCELNLVIDTNLMHAGKNYARLKIRTANQTMAVTVTASRGAQSEKSRQSHVCKIMMKELESLYIRFRLKKIDLNTWVDCSASAIGSYRRAGGKDPFAELFLLQLYFADGKKQKAFKVLENLETQKHRLDTPERYAYYLYMSTFFYHEASYVDRVESQITKMYYRDKTNWKLLWILLYLKESFLKDENARYEAVAEQFRYGCRSRILYLEAFRVLKDNPFLMRHLGKFEMHLLRFAAQEKVLTAEIIRQAAGLTLHYGQFDQTLYEILVAGYQLYPSADLVKAICVLLMKGNKKDSCYFPWYEKGVENGLRITGLYEFYMETMEKLDMRSMPQVIRMYFAYDSSLDHRRRAAIYRKIVENRENDIQAYHNYRTTIERFTLDQLESVRISDDLAVLYRTFLRRTLLNRSSAEKLARILCMYEVTGIPDDFCRIVVHSARLKEEYSAVLQKGRAMIEIYDSDSILLAEDGEGNRSLVSGDKVRKVFEDENMFVWCMEKASDFPGLLLYTCIQCRKENLLNERMLPFFRKAGNLSVLSEAFLTEIRRELLQYYTAHLREESLPDFLEEIPYLQYVKVNKTALITLLAEEGKCKDAFALLDAYGAEGIELLQLVRICSRMVLELEFSENTMLLALCHQCFVMGKYDDKLLRYLLLYYEGTVQNMLQIWNAAVQFELDTMILEEKIMMMLLFTRSNTQGTEPVFEAYMRKLGRKKLCRAYANLKAYEYFVKGLPVGEPVFQYIEREYRYLQRKRRMDEQEEVCRLALLQYYAQAVELTPQQRSRTAALMEEFGAKGLRFGFWKRFDEELLSPYQMEGRVFVEYVCDPASKVTISYRILGREDEYTKEDMKNYFEGIFVREFTLFYGEELECFLEEEKEDTILKTDRRVLQPGVDTGRQNSGYDLLNEISRVQQQEPEKLREELENYLTLEHLAEQVFTLV